MAGWFRRDPLTGVITLCVHAQPGGKRTEVLGLHGDSLKVRVAAPALENRANEALVVFVAERFDVARRDVSLVAGEKSRDKRLEVRASSRDPQAALPVPAKD